MTVMALALARAREGDCDNLEGSPVYDSIGECVGWVGQVLEESGYPCEHMGMGDEGYTSCWSSSEISRLREENEKIRALVHDRTTTAVCVCSGVTGHCECKSCGKSIDPWDGYCRHCGARITEVER